MTTTSALTTTAPAATISLPVIAASIRTLQAELNDLFPEREPVVTQLVYGLLTREHVLVFGTYGTGKSRLVDRFFGAFTDANLFSVECTKFMTEGNVVGIPNPKKLREEGRIWHDREGTILDAQFAELDELFDANDPLLRTLLGILNERRFIRGVQREKANLHTALASTNADPEAVVKQSPTLGALIDRFLFQTQVKYLQQGESRRRMFAKYLSDERPTGGIPYKEVDMLATAVRNLEIDDPVLLDLHDQIVQAFQTASGKIFSDRRACKALELAKANAFLFGRTEVTPDDFLATAWAFCKGHDTVTLDQFKEVATPLIEKVVKERKPDIVRTQMKLIDEFEKRVPQPIPVAGATDAQPTSDELVALRRTLVQLQSDVMAIRPSHAAVEDRQKKLVTLIGKIKGDVGKLIDGEAVV